LLNITASVYKYAPKLVKRLPTPLLKLFIKALKVIFHEKMFFKLYDDNKHLSALPFVENMLKNLHISCTIRPNELQNIPSTGKLIVIANHPTGAVDTMVLIETIANAREDKKVKIVANGMVMSIKQISSLLIPVDNINGAITKHSLKIINEALAKDEALIFFPAGAVNRFSLKGLMDSTWKASFLKIAKRTQTPILPLRIKGSNSILFYLLSMLLPKSLSALFLVHEFAVAGKRKPIHINIGKVIPFASFSDTKISINEYVDMFYAHIYNINTKQNDILETEITIGNTESTKKLKEEIYKAKFLGYSSDGKRIILADADESPFLVSELGRLREISFRAIGGGTGTARDNDLFDNYYKHLVLWDDKDLEIVGAYRIGECKNIIKLKGQEGLYTSNLCKFSEQFKDYCNNSVELGRSFVQPQYWGSRAFDSLWQAVTVYLAHHPHIQYTYGVVTINADTPKKAVAALVYFYSHHFSCSSKMMTAKYPYIISQEDKLEFNSLFNHLNYKDGFVILKRYLKDLGTVVPTLFKQYIELYEEGAVRYFDFSVNDGLFGVVEGFIISDNHRMKRSIQERHLKNFNKDRSIDPLSKVYTRGHFLQQIDSIEHYQRKIDTHSSLIIFDILGEHKEELKNKLILRVAQILKNSLRTDDLIARWSDMSFIIMLKNTSTKQSKCIAENIKHAIHDTRVNGSYKIECSCKLTDPQCINCEDESTIQDEELAC